MNDLAPGTICFLAVRSERFLRFFGRVVTAIGPPTTDAEGIWHPIDAPWLGVAFPGREVAAISWARKPITPPPAHELRELLRPPHRAQKAA